MPYLTTKRELYYRGRSIHCPFVRETCVYSGGAPLVSGPAQRLRWSTATMVHPGICRRRTTFDVSANQSGCDEPLSPKWRLKGPPIGGGRTCIALSAERLLRGRWRQCIASCDLEIVWLGIGIGWFRRGGGGGGGGVRVTRGDGRRQFLWATEDISAGAAAARRNNVALRASHYKRDTVAAMRRKAFISAPCPTR